MPGNGVDVELPGGMKLGPYDGLMTGSGPLRKRDMAGDVVDVRSVPAREGGEAIFVATSEPASLMPRSGRGLETSALRLVAERARWELAGVAVDTPLPLNCPLRSIEVLVPCI